MSSTEQPPSVCVSERKAAELESACSRSGERVDACWSIERDRQGRGLERQEEEEKGKERG